MRVTSAVQARAALAIADRSPLSVLAAVTIIGAALPLDTREQTRRRIDGLAPAAALDAALDVLYAD